MLHVLFNTAPLKGSGVSLHCAWLAELRVLAKGGLLRLMHTPFGSLLHYLCSVASEVCMAQLIHGTRSISTCEVTGLFPFAALGLLHFSFKI
jgi:hypothetical protein